MRRSLALCSSLALLAAALGGAIPLRADEYSRGGTFILPGWDAKGAALGGAAVALSQDESAAYWNPANLTFLPSARFGLGTMEPVPGVGSRYSVLSAAMSFSERREGTRWGSGPGESPSDTSLTEGGPAASWDTMPWRRAAVALSASHLGLELAGGSRWNESTIAVSGAYAPRPGTSLGVTVRGMKSWTDLADAGSWGVTFDAGVVERLTDHAWIAATGKNIFGLVSYPERVDTLDSTWNIALACRGLFDRVSMECDAVIAHRAIDRLLVGVELLLVPKLLSVLGGAEVRMTGGERVIPSVGVATTFRYAEIAISSSFDPIDAFGIETRVSASLLFPQ